MSEYKGFEPADDSPVRRQLSIRPSIAVATVVVALSVALFFTIDRLGPNQIGLVIMFYMVMVPVTIALYVREECVITEIERAKGRRKSTWDRW
jgi:hypothetical protein